MHYYLGNIVSYKALQHFGRVLFQGYVCGLSRKDFDRHTPHVQVVCFILLSLIFTLKLQDWL